MRRGLLPRASPDDPMAGDWCSPPASLPLGKEKCPLLFLLPSPWAVTPQVRPWPYLQGRGYLRSG